MQRLTFTTKLTLILGIAGYLLSGSGAKAQDAGKLRLKNAHMARAQALRQKAAALNGQPNPAASQKAAAEKAAREKAEAERKQREAAAEKAAREKAEAERQHLAALEAERQKQLRLQQEAAERQRKEQLAREAAEKAAREKAEAERKRQEQLRLQQEAAERQRKEQLAREAAEKAAREKAEAERKQREAAATKAEQERIAREAAAKAEAERKQREATAAKAEQERIAREAAAKAEAERKQREAAATKAEQERIAREAAAKAEAERKQREAAATKAEQERIAREAAAKAEAERKQREATAAKAEQERIAREAAAKAEAERKQREATAAKAEQERIAREAAAKAEAERKQREAAEKAEAERLRLAALEAERQEQLRLQQEAAERQRQEQLAREAAEAERLRQEQLRLQQEAAAATAQAEAERQNLVTLRKIFGAVVNYLTSHPSSAVAGAEEAAGEKPEQERAIQSQQLEGVRDNWLVVNGPNEIVEAQRLPSPPAAQPTAVETLEPPSFAQSADAEPLASHQSPRPTTEVLRQERLALLQQSYVSAGEGGETSHFVSLPSLPHQGADEHQTELTPPATAAFQQTSESQRHAGTSSPAEHSQSDDDNFDFEVLHHNSSQPSSPELGDARTDNHASLSSALPPQAQVHALLTEARHTSPPVLPPEQYTAGSLQQQAEELLRSIRQEDSTAMAAELQVHPYVFLTSGSSPRSASPESNHDGEIPANLPSSASHHSATEGHSDDDFELLAAVAGGDTLLTPPQSVTARPVPQHMNTSQEEHSDSEDGDEQWAQLVLSSRDGSPRVVSRSSSPKPVAQPLADQQQTKRPEDDDADGDFEVIPSPTPSTQPPAALLHAQQQVPQSMHEDEEEWGLVIDRNGLPSIAPATSQQRGLVMGPDSCPRMASTPSMRQPRAAKASTSDDDEDEFVTVFSPSHSPSPLDAQQRTQQPLAATPAVVPAVDIEDTPAYVSPPSSDQGRRDTPHSAPRPSTPDKAELIKRRQETVAREMQLGRLATQPTAPTRGVEEWRAQERDLDAKTQLASALAHVHDNYFTPNDDSAAPVEHPQQHPATLHLHIRLRSGPPTSSPQEEGSPRVATATTTTAPPPQPMAAAAQPQQPLQPVVRPRADEKPDLGFLERWLWNPLGRGSSHKTDDDDLDHY